MKSNKVKILSFIGGLAFFSIVATILITKNDRLKREVELQASSLLEASRNVVTQVQFVTEKVNRIKSEINTAKSLSNNEQDQKALLAESYDNAWNDAEIRASEFVRNKES